MGQVCRYLDLAEEPFGTHGGSQLRAEDFDRDRAVVFEVLSKIDGRHAAFAQEAFDFVPIGEGRGEPGGNLGHDPQR